MITIGIADPKSRAEIYRIRHDVYAGELGQHSMNPEGVLTDDLDRDNTYIIARNGAVLCGFISITSSGSTNYSIDKYFDRSVLPFPMDDTVREVRLLTVLPVFRHSPIAFLLMYATLDWIEARGGKRVVAIGRREIMPLYKKCGLRQLDTSVTSGAVTFDLMTATIKDLRFRAGKLSDVLARAASNVVWEIGAASSSIDRCYHGGAFYKAIGERFDDLSRRECVIKADTLDAWFPPSPKSLAAVEEHLPWLLSTSPPTNATGLEEIISEQRGVEPVNVLAGGGSSDLMFLALTNLLDKDSRVLILDPMYGEYQHIIENIVGAKAARLTLTREDDFAMRAEVLREAISHNYDHILLVNPNSPTGQYFSNTELRKAIELAPAETQFWIDETYIEYVGKQSSLERFAAQRGNVTICKSMSKCYALSGARVAYLIGSAQRIEELRRFNPPWSVSHVAQVAAAKALMDVDYYESCYRTTHELRETLAAQLRQLGWTVFPSVANFLLCELPSELGSASAFVRRVARCNLFLRDVESMGSFPNDRFIRITVLDQQSNRQMLEIITTLCGVL